MDHSPTRLENVQHSEAQHPTIWPDHPRVSPTRHTATPARSTREAQLEKPSPSREPGRIEQLEKNARGATPTHQPRGAQLEEKAVTRSRKHRTGSRLRHYLEPDGAMPHSSQAQPERLEPLEGDTRGAQLDETRTRKSRHPLEGAAALVRPFISWSAVRTILTSVNAQSGMRIKHLEIEEAPPPPAADSRAASSAGLSKAEIPHYRPILEVNRLDSWGLSTIEADEALPEAVPDHPRPPRLMRRRSTRAKPQRYPHTQPTTAPRKVASSVGSMTTAPKIEPIADQRNTMSSSRSVMRSPPNARHSSNHSSTCRSRGRPDSYDRPSLG